VRVSIIKLDYFERNQHLAVYSPRYVLKNDNM